MTEWATGPRMFCLMRTDLGDKIPRGKLIGSGGHAFQMCFWEAINHPKRNKGIALEYARSEEHTKIVLGAKDETVLLLAAQMCKLADIPHHLVTDFAHTVFREKTVTCLGIGPLVGREEYNYLKLDMYELFK